MGRAELPSHEYESVAPGTPSMQRPSAAATGARASNGKKLAGRDCRTQFRVAGGHKNSCKSSLLPGKSPANPIADLICRKRIIRGPADMQKRRTLPPQSGCR